MTHQVTRAADCRSAARLLVARPSVSRRPLHPTRAAAALRRVLPESPDSSLTSLAAVDRASGVCPPLCLEAARLSVGHSPAECLFCVSASLVVGRPSAARPSAARPSPERPSAERPSAPRHLVELPSAGRQAAVRQAKRREATQVT